MSENATLFDRIGADDAVTATVAKLYEKILADDQLSIFFEGVDMERLRRSQKSFVTMAFGGPNHYEGPHLRKAHQHLVDKGLNGHHFDLVARYLDESMQELGVPEDLRSEALTIVASTRNDVLCN
tara:strand:+ start:812 stop:1186 length:375 start_codon:yes stop_codon:yes gene_type:complete